MLLFTPADIVRIRVQPVARIPFYSLDLRQSDTVVRIESHFVSCVCLVIDELGLERVEAADFVTHVYRYGMSMK